jgi:hypothetical protein
LAKSGLITKRNIHIVALISSLLLISGLSPAAVEAKPTFGSYELRSKHEEILFLDFDGDKLDDIVVIDEPNLVFFFQDHRHGFGKDPHLIYALDGEPSIIWPAKLSNSPDESILVMTHDGVSTLTYTDRATPPSKQRIISQRTLIPDQCEESTVIFLALSANSAKEFPSIFVPTENGLQIWQHDNRWHQRHSLGNIPEAEIWGPHEGIGYTKQYLLNMNIADLNSDGLDDVVVCKNDKGKITFDVYPQNNDGIFGPAPSQSFKDQWDWRSWVSLADINKDGNVDFIKNTWLQEPWFLPGTYSGKVLVRIFLSQANRTMPDEPTFVFRKNDWTSSIPIVDLDGDGFQDIVLGYSLMRGREDVRKSMTAQRLDHYLRIHFYENGGYHERPHCQKDLAIHIGHHGVHLSISRRHYLQTQMSVAGDFDGDGDRDLLVKDRQDKASVYFFISRKKGFSRRADMYFDNIERVEQFIVDDLNEDGISDLVVVGPKKDAFKVLLSKRK